MLADLAVGRRHAAASLEFSNEGQDVALPLGQECEPGICFCRRHKVMLGANAA